MANGGEDLADFLKREDEKLAEIGDISLVRTSPPPDTNLAESAERDSHTPVSPLAEASEMSAYQPYAIHSSHSVVLQRRSSVEFIQRPPSTELASSSEDLYDGGAQTQGQEDTLFAGGEPECIQSWRGRKEEMLDQKEAEASEEMRRWREAAQQELRDWYDHHNSQVETRKQDNRAAEEAFITERDQSVPGTEWEKVANLCEFSGKTPGKTSKDVSRMRSIYLHLKENPPIRN